MLDGVSVEATAEADVIECRTTATDRDAVLRELSDWLIRGGYAAPGFGEALRTREAEFPTGLEGDGGGVAVPHAEPGMVSRPAVILCRPEAPIPFRRMDAPDEEVGAELVLLLAIPDAKRHLDLLRTLSSVFSDAALFAELRAGATLADLIRKGVVQA